MPRTRALTTKQQRVLEAIQAEPWRASVRRVSSDTGYSMDVVRRAFRALEERGLVTLEKKKRYHTVRMRDQLFGGETSARHWELEATPTSSGGSGMSRNRQRRNARRYSETLTAGFAIATWAESTIEEDSRERFGPDYGDPDERVRLLDERMIEDDGTPTRKGWEALNNDLMRLERNVVRWLGKAFESARDEGHSDDELIGSIRYDPDSSYQRELISSARYEAVDINDVGRGDLADDAWTGVSDFGLAVLGADLVFFDVEGMEEEED
jgi:hypothetical protein